jgi:hypothetical protein
MGSLQAVPQFDRGKSLNMVLSMRRQPNGFDPEYLPQHKRQRAIFEALVIEACKRLQMSHEPQPAPTLRIAG